MEAKAIVAPDHGVVHIRQGTAFPKYVPGGPPYACDAIRSPATIITDRSSPGFAGEDTTAVFRRENRPIPLAHKGRGADTRDHGQA